MEIRSQGIENNKAKDKYGNRCESKYLIDEVPILSIPLDWDNVPIGTKSFALTFIDYDNVVDEGVPWIHWIVADLSAQKRSLKENESRMNTNLIQGTNSWSAAFEGYRKGKEITQYYGGPAPKNQHEYELELFALDAKFDLKEGFFYNELRKKIDGHIIERAKLKFLY